MIILPLPYLILTNFNQSKEQGDRDNLLMGDHAMLNKLQARVLHLRIIWLDFHNNFVDVLLKVSYN